MTNKSLILGVVAALAMAGGQANAQSACPADTTIAALRASGFSCTIGNKMFSGFDFSPGTQFGRTLVDFDNSGSDTTIGFSAPTVPPVGFPPDSRFVAFTVSIIPTAKALIGSYTLDVAANHPEVTTDAAVVGNLSGDHSLTGEGSFSNVRVFKPADNSDVVRIVFSPLTSRLNSIDNTFASVSPTGVPEPMSVSLFGLGLAGLALARRRR